MATQHDIFISHSSKDKPLAEKLVDILLTNGCDVSANQILCTSLEGMDIPPGTQSFIEFLRHEIQLPKLVILLLTENYFASNFCVCELGASWGMDHPTFPLMVPPFRNSDLRATLKVAQAGSILEPSYLDELRDAVIDCLGQKVKTARWNIKCKEFLKVAPKIISKLPQPDKVDRSLLVEAQEQCSEAVDEIAAKDEEIDSLNEQIEALKKCKDAAEVRKIVRQFTDTEDQFEALCNAASKALGKLRPATREALYWHLRGGNFMPKGDDDWDDVKSAVEVDEVVDPEDGSCHPNLSHPRVSKAEDALNELSAFITDQEVEDPPFIESFEEEHDFPLSISNKEFWSQYLAHV